jgi:ABC-type uncharacterized transport system involved in gliding motility auxiliary subunit
MPLAPRTSLRLQSWLFAVLVVACAALGAWLTTQYHRKIDLTASNRHTLSEASRTVLGAISGPVKVTAYARNDLELRAEIRKLIDRYQQRKPDLELAFLDPDTVPDLVREQGVTQDGELVLTHGKRTEHVQQLTEQALTDALQRLGRGADRFIAFIEGHGERSPFGDANHDVGEWGKRLQSRGFKLQQVNLGATAIPDNTTVLVLASPQIDLLPGEVEAIRKFLDGGGNLLWFMEPGAARGLTPLADALGVSRVDGTVVDPLTQAFGVDNAAFVVVTRYGPAAALDGFRYLTVFPFAAGLKHATDPGWNVIEIASSSEHAWSETGKAEGEVQFDATTDQQGPFALGLMLTRTAPTPSAADTGAAATPKEQRVVVFGDGDFLANSYLGNAGNLDLGLRLVNWLAADESFVNVPARTAADLTLQLPSATGMLLGVWFLFLAPLALVAIAVAVWRRRST